MSARGACVGVRAGVAYVAEKGKTKEEEGRRKKKIKKGVKGRRTNHIPVGICLLDGGRQPRDG